VDTQTLRYTDDAKATVPLHQMILEETISEDSHAAFTSTCEQTINFLRDSNRHDQSPPTDLFTFAFVILSRYEEYLQFDPDQHGRFTSSHSILKELGILRTPIVDHVLLWFSTYVNVNLGIDLTRKQQQTTHMTFDIDHLWQYKNKSTAVSTGGLLKDLMRLDFTAITERIRVNQGRLTDHYDLSRWENYMDFTKVTFFILMNHRTQYDKGISPEHPAFAKAINQLKTTSPVGIHPGYETSSNIDNLSTQISIYHSLVNAKPTLSRQHYLRLRLPITYRLLIRAGIKDEYSMGYADDIGYRAGTSRPFLWYDLESESATTLTLYPFAVMDVTLVKYLGLSPRDAFTQVKKIRNAAAKVGGTCRLIWHNSSPFWVSPWSPYLDTFQLFNGSKSG